MRPENPAYSEIGPQRVAGCGRVFPVLEFRINTVAENPLRSKRTHSKPLHNRPITFAGSRLKLLSAELASKCCADVGIGIRAGVSTSDEYSVGVIGWIMQISLGAVRLCRILVAVPSHRHRRRCGCRAGKHQREHQT